MLDVLTIQTARYQIGIYRGASDDLVSTPDTLFAPFRSLVYNFKPCSSLNKKITGVNSLYTRKQFIFYHLNGHYLAKLVSVLLLSVLTLSSLFQIFLSASEVRHRTGGLCRCVSASRC